MQAFAHLQSVRTRQQTVSQPSDVESDKPASRHPNFGYQAQFGSQERRISLVDVGCSHFESSGPEEKATCSPDVDDMRTPLSNGRNRSSRTCFKINPGGANATTDGRLHWRIRRAGRAGQRNVKTPRRSEPMHNPEAHAPEVRWLVVSSDEDAFGKAHLSAAISSFS
eukprot:3867579-Rhodomonas_salina.3